jgi:putative GTP pyrophosphokinase
MARYDDLRGMVCEIQVRTVLQDAWAIIQHHLVYKQESQVPRTLQRKLNSLAGLLETADYQCERIRADRESYLDSIRSSADTPNFLNNDLNSDSFKEFLTWRFPGRSLEGWEGQLSMCFDWIDSERYKYLEDLENLLISTESYRKQIDNEIGDTVTREDPNSGVPANVEIFWAMYLVEPDFGGADAVDEAWEESLQKYRREYQAEHSDGA